MTSDRDIRRIYDSFAIKDLSYEAFQREVRKLQDPARAAIELANIRKSVKIKGKN